MLTRFQAGLRRHFKLAAAGVLLACALPLVAQAQKKYDPGASDTEIKIGSLSPYSGPASAYGTAGKASKNMGRNTAVCTSAARNDEPVSSTINQAAAMDCMPLPMKKMPPHRHRPLNAGWRRGAQIEVEAAAVIRVIIPQHGVFCAVWAARVSPCLGAGTAARGPLAISSVPTM